MNTAQPSAPAGAAALHAGVPLQTRGVVQPGALYVVRAVDQAVAAALRAGQWTAILGPRFGGKSSLRARTAGALAVDPASAVAVDPASAADSASVVAADSASAVVADPASAVVADPASAVVADPASAVVADPAVAVAVDLASAVVAGPAAADPVAPVPLRCATIELRPLIEQQGAGGVPYLLLCSMLATQLRLPAVSAFWQRHSEAPPVERFRRFLLEEVAEQTARTVILIDDLDALAVPPLSAAELLAALHSVQQELAAGGASAALTVAVFSALPLSRLGAADRARWDGSVFMLPDFTRGELDAFAPALTALSQDGGATAAEWLDAVFAWTAGHPALTQHLCQQLVARAKAATPAAGPGGTVLTPADRVERLVGTLYLDKDALPEALQHDPCVREPAQALTASPHAQALLSLYRRLLSGMPVAPDPLDELQRELRLCGLSTEAQDATGALRLRPRGRLLAGVLGEDWAREQEVRLVLREASQREQATPDAASGGPLLRGSALKTAQAWARKHPAALHPAEIRVLVASLEAARSEVEAKHQASAAALQRELRDKTQARLGPGLPGGVGQGGRRIGAAGAAPAGPSGPAPPRPAVIPIVGIGLLLCVSLVALASTYHRMGRLEHAAHEAAARAQRAEQALQALQGSRTPLAGADPTAATSIAQIIQGESREPAGEARGALTATKLGPGDDESGPRRRGAPGPVAAQLGPREGAAASGDGALPVRATSPAPAPEHRKSAAAGKLAKRRAPPLRPAAPVHAAARVPGNCPVPGRSGAP